MKALLKFAVAACLMTSTVAAQQCDSGCTSILNTKSLLECDASSEAAGCDRGSCDGCCSGNTRDSLLGCGACDAGGCDGVGGCGCDQPGWSFSGWVNAGYMANFSSPASRFQGPYNAVDRSNEPMLNQIYLVAERGLPGQGTGWGARFDYLFGQDFLLAQSVGLERNDDGSARWNNEHYGSAIPQAYVTLGNRDLNIQAGHFYSVVGFEGLMAPANFFYSKSYSYQFAGPFTHWGAQTNWKASESWTVQAGVHNGWDALDRTTDRMGFIGKLRYDSRATGAWTSFAITTGDETNNLAGLPITNEFTNRTRYSWIASMPLSCKTEYVFHHWLGFQERGAAGGERADWFGVDQYLFHQINNKWRAGLRFEWFKDEEGTRVGLNRASNPNKPPFVGNFYSTTLGLNYTPCDHFVLRPEVRLDWFDGTGQPYDDGSDDFQSMAGFDAILSF